MNSLQLFIGNDPYDLEMKLGFSLDEKEEETKLLSPFHWCLLMEILLIIPLNVVPLPKYMNLK